MDLLVHKVILNCLLCQLNDKTAKTAPVPLQPVDFPDGPWQKLGLDIVGPFEHAASGCRFAISLVDYYSKWPEVFILTFDKYNTWVLSTLDFG